MTEFYKVASMGQGYLAVMPRPGVYESLPQTMQYLQKNKISVVVSLLEPQESIELGLQSEENECHKVGIEFRSFPIKDRSVPHDMKAVSKLIEWAYQKIINGNNLVFHCHGGIGRSGTMAACALLKTGIDPQEAFEMVSKARGLTIPETIEQREWVEEKSYNIINNSSLLRSITND